jgi:hypothetical protein
LAGVCQSCGEYSNDGQLVDEIGHGGLILSQRPSECQIPEARSILRRFLFDVVNYDHGHFTLPLLQLQS